MAILYDWNATISSYLLGITSFKAPAFRAPQVATHVTNLSSVLSSDFAAHSWPIEAKKIE
jgi:hypothetical protein